LDFGPLNLGHLFRFCSILNAKLSDSRLENKVIYFYSGTHPHKRTNAAFLICAWAILHLQKTPEEAYAPFRSVYPPFPTWHDATPTKCYFTLTVLDTLKGLEKARRYKFFDADNFNRAEYEHYEQVENGDLNWCMDNKFIAFAGPHASKEPMEGYYALSPDDYIPYFKRKNVTLVIRFNQPYYDARRFTSQGIEHADLYFVDGTNPPEKILTRFLQLCEETPGAVAVHCKAGLGRTGTCIGCYMMKHYRITAEETIGWLRIVRPGSVIGPQQQFLKDIQSRMWREGDLMRERQEESGIKSVLFEESERERSDVATGVGGLSIASESDDRPGSRGATLKSGGGFIAPSVKPPPNVVVQQTSSASSSSIGLAGRRVIQQSTTTTTSNSSTVAISPEEDKYDSAGNKLTQGDILRLRRTQGVKTTTTTTTTDSSTSVSTFSAESKTAAQNRPSSSASRGLLARYLGK
jgi:cell division cycle 14